MKHDYSITDLKLVKVRYWKADDSTTSEAKKSTGHISLQTHFIYASFWPHETEITDIKLIEQNNSSGCFAGSPEFDIEKYNKREPYKTIELKTLNVPAINKKFAEIKQNGTSYDGLLGSSPICGRTLNCCSLVYSLLKTGAEQKPIKTRFKALDPQCKAKYYFMLAGLLFLVGGGLMVYLRKNTLTASQTQEAHNSFRTDALKWMNGESLAKPLTESLENVITTTRTSINSLCKFGVFVTTGGTIAASSLSSFFRSTLTPQDALAIAKGLEQWEKNPVKSPRTF